MGFKNFVGLETVPSSSNSSSKRKLEDDKEEKEENKLETPKKTLRVNEKKEEKEDVTGDFSHHHHQKKAYSFIIDFNIKEDRMIKAELCGLHLAEKLKDKGADVLINEIKAQIHKTSF